MYVRTYVSTIVCTLPQVAVQGSYCCSCTVHAYLCSRMDVRLCYQVIPGVPRAAFLLEEEVKHSPPLWEQGGLKGSTQCETSLGLSSMRKVQKNRCFRSCTHFAHWLANFTKDDDSRYTQPLKTIPQYQMSRTTSNRGSYTILFHPSSYRSLQE